MFLASALSSQRKDIKLAKANYKYEKRQRELANRNSNKPKKIQRLKKTRKHL